MNKLLNLIYFIDNVKMQQICELQQDNKTGQC